LNWDFLLLCYGWIWSVLKSFKSTLQECTWFYLYNSWFAKQEKSSRMLWHYELLMMDIIVEKSLHTCLRSWIRGGSGRNPYLGLVVRSIVCFVSSSMSQIYFLHIDCSPPFRVPKPLPSTHYIAVQLSPTEFKRRPHSQNVDSHPINIRASYKELWAKLYLCNDER
jgi:hypothetical protein